MAAINNVNRYNPKMGFMPCNSSSSNIQKSKFFKKIVRLKSQSFLTSYVFVHNTLLLAYFWYSRLVMALWKKKKSEAHSTFYALKMYSLTNNRRNRRSNFLSVLNANTSPCRNHRSEALSVLRTGYPRKRGSIPSRSKVPKPAMGPTTSPI